MYLLFFVFLLLQRLYFLLVFVLNNKGGNKYDNVRTY